jgi:hypothetical protein
MKQRIANALRSMADRLDPPPPPALAPQTFRITEPVFSPEQVARIGKQIAEVMKNRPKLNIPVLPSPPAPPAPRRLK